MQNQSNPKIKSRFSVPYGMVKIMQVIKVRSQKKTDFLQP
jgi:hypothetical protein